MKGGKSSKGDSDLWKPKEAALHTHPCVCFQRSYIPTSRTFIQSARRLMAGSLLWDLGGRRAAPVSTTQPPVCVCS